MNERIRELAEQAIIVVDNHILIEEEELKKMYIPDCFAEKFALLIMRESIVDFYRNHLDTTSNEDITQQVERYIKNTHTG